MVQVEGEEPGWLEIAITGVVKTLEEAKRKEEEKEKGGLSAKEPCKGHHGKGWCPLHSRAVRILLH